MRKNLLIVLLLSTLLLHVMSDCDENCEECDEDDLATACTICATTTDYILLTTKDATIGECTATCASLQSWTDTVTNVGDNDVLVNYCSSVLGIGCPDDYYLKASLTSEVYTALGPCVTCDEADLVDTYSIFVTYFNDQIWNYCIPSSQIPESNALYFKITLQALLAIFFLTF
jgi:hypothetical protein